MSERKLRPGETLVQPKSPGSMRRRLSNATTRSALEMYFEVRVYPSGDQFVLTFVGLNHEIDVVLQPDVAEALVSVLSEGGRPECVTRADT